MRFFVIFSLIISVIVIRLRKNEDNVKSHAVNAG